MVKGKGFLGTYQRLQKQFSIFKKLWAEFQSFIASKTHLTAPALDVVQSIITQLQFRGILTLLRMRKTKGSVNAFPPRFSFSNLIFKLLKLARIVPQLQ